MSKSLVLRHKIFPKSVQSGIPKIKPPKKGWMRYKFGDLFEVKKRPISMHDEEDYKLVTVKRSRGGVAKRSILKGAKISVKNQFIIEENDFLISKRQIVHGACGIVPYDLAGSIVSNEYSVLVPREKFDLRFLGYLSHSVYFQQTCFHSSVGVHVEKMIFKLDDWFKWPVNLPSLSEQKKISDFLGAVDAKIAGLRAREYLLSQYKKGVMQKIFTQTLRFKANDGSDCPDWEEKKLKDLTSVITKGTTPTSVGHQFRNRGILFLKAESLTKKGGIIQEKCAFITEDCHQQLNRSQINHGDILFSIAGTLGRAAIYKLNEPANTNQALAIIRTIEQINTEFLFQFLNTHKIKKRISQLLSVGAQPNLSLGQIGSFNIPFPHPDEQKKIANFLSAIDDKISAVSDQITQMQDFKKGLLQQMFV